jgi:multiple sugar transport system permease protein
MMHNNRSKESSPMIRQRRSHLATAYHRSLYLLLLPYLIGTTLLVIVPIGYTIGLSFTTYDALSPPIWNGLGNFRMLVSNPLFITAIRNSLLFVSLTIPLRVLLTLMVALLLNRWRRGVGFYRAAIYLPTIIPSVAYALTWLWILNPFYGPLNLVLGSLGIAPIAWFANSATALPALAFTSLFQIGEGFVVLLAGLREIPDEYYAAAAIDGASGLAMFRYLTLPLSAPWLFLLTIRDMIMTAQSTFAPTLIMTQGGPYYATLFLPLLIYKTAFDRFRFGEAAAMTLVVLGSVGLLIMVMYLLLGGWGYDDEV